MKAFKVKWGSGYVNQTTSIVYMDDINNENGWDESSLEKIDDLQVGQYADCSDIGGDVFVQRIA